MLNVSFWNPTLLAREIVTTDILTGGRVEIGLGAGHMKYEYDLAGIDWEPFAARADRLAEMIADLGRIFEREVSPLPGGQAPRPIHRQRLGGVGAPLLVGGTGDRILRIAAEHANIIGVAGVYRSPESHRALSGWARQPRPTSGSGLPERTRASGLTSSNGSCSSRWWWNRRSPHHSRECGRTPR